MRGSERFGLCTEKKKREKIIMRGEKRYNYNEREDSICLAWSFQDVGYFLKNFFFICYIK